MSHILRRAGLLYLSFKRLPCRTNATKSLDSKLRTSVRRSGHFLHDEAR